MKWIRFYPPPTKIRKENDMKAMFIVKVLLASILYVGGIYMAIQSIPNWGWLIFCGLLITPSLSYLDEDSIQKQKD